MIAVDNPTYQNLIGRIEHLQNMGALFTDFTLIKPGALHQANGGYLLVDVLKLLQQRLCLGRAEAGAEVGSAAASKVWARPWV